MNMPQKVRHYLGYFLWKEKLRESLKTQAIKTLVASIKGTKSQDIIDVINRIPLDILNR